MSDRKDQKIAMLIDADNVSYKKIEEILNEVNRYGTPTIKRIYGDWTNPFVENWKSSLLTHAITPIQQYGYTQGKNATDSALIIDAMDILHSDRVDGFCIVSSDSDFTRLATRLRESGKLVIGIGERKTPKPFIASCDKFIYVEILDHKSKSKKKNADQQHPATGNGAASGHMATSNGNNSTIGAATATAPKANAKPPVRENIPLDDDTLLLLKDTVDDTADENGWAFLGEIGNLIIKRKPDFDARNYGFEKISHLFKSRKADFEVEERANEKSRNKLYYVRNILASDYNGNPSAGTIEQVTAAPASSASSGPAVSKRGSKTKKSPQPSPLPATESAPITRDSPTPMPASGSKSESASVSFHIPSDGNKITADDVRKHQIRITKDLKSYFPTRTRKISIIINDQFECTFSHRRDRSHVLNLGKDAAAQLELTEGSVIGVFMVDEHTFRLTKQG